MAISRRVGVTVMRSQVVSFNLFYLRRVLYKVALVVLSLGEKRGFRGEIALTLTSFERPSLFSQQGPIITLSSSLCT